MAKGAMKSMTVQELIDALLATKQPEARVEVKGFGFEMKLKVVDVRCKCNAVEIVGKVSYE
jgi:hypothetical protein